jgi:hypothetical protein
MVLQRQEITLEAAFRKPALPASPSRLQCRHVIVLHNSSPPILVGHAALLSLRTTGEPDFDTAAPPQTTCVHRDRDARRHDGARRHHVLGREPAEQQIVASAFSASLSADRSKCSGKSSAPLRGLSIQRQQVGCAFNYGPKFV